VITLMARHVCTGFLMRFTSLRNLVRRITALANAKQKVSTRGATVAGLREIRNPNDLPPEWGQVNGIQTSVGLIPYDLNER